MSQITHARRPGIWVLTTASESSYVLHVGAHGMLRCLHWGRALTVEQAASLLEYPAPRERSCEDPQDGLLDLAAAGGLRYGYAGLQVRFADGTRDLELEYLGHRVEGGELALLFADVHFPLEIEACYRVRPDSPAIERHLTLRHTGEPGTEPIDVERADAATWLLPELADYWLSRSYGQWSAENRVHRGQLTFGETVLGSRRGVTSHQANPWAMIDDGTASEEHGTVYGAALAWSGSWQLVAQRTPGNRVGLSLGHGHTPSIRSLEPGDELRSPVSIGIHTEGGFGAAYRLGDPDRDTSGVQYVSRDGTETVVLAYRTARRFGAAAQVLPLRGLDTRARYRDPDTGREHHGAVLQARGVPLDLPAGDPASTLVRLRRVGTSTQAQLIPNGVNQQP